MTTLLRLSIATATCAANMLLAVLPATADEGLYPGWEKDAIRMNAFDGCMFDYGITPKESAKEWGRYWKSLGGKVTPEMQVLVVERNKDWKDRYNRAIEGMTEVCFKAARRIDPGIFRIDYSKGGKHGWRSSSVVHIGMKDCLESDPRMTEEKKKILMWEAGANDHDMANIILREKRTLNRAVLNYNLREQLKKLGAGSPNCNELLRALSPDSPDMQRQKPQVSSVKMKPETQNTHKNCIEAKDYAGCMKFYTEKDDGSNQPDECDENHCLVKAKGLDVYGLPKPVGWFYKQLDDGRILYFSRVSRVPHKGQETRYIGLKRITRYYQSPESGTSGTMIGSGSSTSNCYVSGKSISCTTSGSPPTYIPGRSATPGGVTSTFFYSVYDCSDMTGASYKDGKLFSGGWTKTPQSYPSQILEAVCTQGKEFIEKLQPLYVKM